MIKAIQLFDEFCEKSDYSVVELRGERQSDGTLMIFVRFQKSNGISEFAVNRVFGKDTLQNDILLECDLRDMEAELQHYLEEMDYES
jgi:hypothetical protein